MANSFGSEVILRVGDREYTIHRLTRWRKHPNAWKAPAVLPEGPPRKPAPHQEEGLASPSPRTTSRPWPTGTRRLSRTRRSPSRWPGCLLQDFTGVLPPRSGRRCATPIVNRMGCDPKKINPLLPGRASHRPLRAGGPISATLRSVCRRMPMPLSYLPATGSRYAFLRWGQEGAKQLQGRRRPTPVSSIRLILNTLAYASPSPQDRGYAKPRPLAYPDTLVGTDSHTTMINGLGVLGWGVGGIEAEAAMLGQPVSMLIPEVVGFRLQRQAAEGATATDLVLTVTQM